MKLVITINAESIADAEGVKKWASWTEAERLVNLGEVAIGAEHVMQANMDAGGRVYVKVAVLGDDGQELAAVERGGAVNPTGWEPRDWPMNEGHGELTEGKRAPGCPHGLMGFCAACDIESWGPVVRKT